MKQKNGQLLNLELSANSDLNDEGNIVMRNALQESERKYRILIENSQDGIFIIQDAKIQFANQAFARMVGYDVEDVTGEDFQKFVAPEDLEMVLDRYRRRQATEHVPREYEFSMLHKDGKTRIIVNMNVGLITYRERVASMGTVKDISERKHAEDKLRLFRNLIDQSNDAIFVSDPETGRILDANDKACVNLGYKREELLNMHVLDFEINLLNHISWKEYCKEVQNRRSILFECRHRHKNGKTFPVEVNISFIGVGKINYMVAVVRDITERKQAEEKIKKSLEEKEVLLREIHHRVKNNMQIVASLLNLQSQNFEDKKYKDLFIDSQSRIYAMALVHEKLYQSESLAKIDIKEYIDGVVSNIFESYGQKSNVKFDINIENIPINIDYAVPCGLIINEILTNSFKYAFPDGRQGTIKISVKSNDNDMIQISISDNGIGIPKDLDIRNTKSLGLKLITSLAEGQLHGGIILNRDSGTEFIINFRQTK